METQANLQHSQKYNIILDKDGKSLEIWAMMRSRLVKLDLCGFHVTFIKASYECSHSELILLCGNSYTTVSFSNKHLTHLIYFLLSAFYFCFDEIWILIPQPLLSRKIKNQNAGNMEKNVMNAAL